VTRFLENDTQIITAYAGIDKHIESSNPGVEADIDEISAMLEPLLVQNDSVFNKIIVARKNTSEKFRFKLE
jgi:hypothetical protein